MVHIKMKLKYSIENGYELVELDSTGEQAEAKKIYKMIKDRKPVKEKLNLSLEILESRIM